MPRRSYPNRRAIDIGQYEQLKNMLLLGGYRQEVEWAQTVRRPEDPDAFAREAIWVICCSGFREQAARVTQAGVNACLSEGRSARDVFPKSGKGRAIDRIWANRAEYHQALEELCRQGSGAAGIIGWIASLPYVGGATLRFHFAKNLGIDCAKPDRWLCRLAGIPMEAPMEHRFEAVMDYCRPLAEASGDRIATVDLVLWRGCNLGILVP